MKTAPDDPFKADASMTGQPALIDYHCHTQASDGLLTPQELIAHAQQRGLVELAITDHDTLAGYRAVQALTPATLRLIPAAEWSGQWQGASIHIVSLNIQPEQPATQALEQSQLAVRAKRAQLICERLQQQGCADVWPSARKLAGRDSLGRPHIAKALVALGYVSTEAVAFQRYLGAGKLGDVKACWPSIDELCQAIAQMGGVAVLAHPHKYKLTRSKLQRLLDHFRQVGGSAVEVAIPGMHPDLCRWLTRYCQQYQLLASTGSDFHGPVSAWSDLGLVPAMPNGLTPVWSAWRSA